MALILIAVALITILGFYLNGKNKLEAEKQQQAVLGKQYKTQQAQTVAEQKTTQKSVPIIKKPTSKKLIASVDLEREKCHYRYIVSQEWDTGKDMEDAITESNYDVQQLQDQGNTVDFSSVFEAVKKYYFTEKYEACLDNIK